MAFARVAQLAERSIRNAEVVGSTPTGGFSEVLILQGLRTNEKILF